MKTSVKIAVTAAAAVFALGIIFGAWYLQTYYGVDSTPAADGETPAASAPAGEKETLRVLTDSIVWHSKIVGEGGSVNGVTATVAKLFELSHPGVQVEVEILPFDDGYTGRPMLEVSVADNTPREQRLQQLRTEIMAGNGPDVFLLPTGGSSVYEKIRDRGVYEDGTEWASYESAPFYEDLFPDVVRAMQNGRFYDLNAFYDADDALEKDGLNQQIMDAGVLDGKRLVLPLGYNMNVLAADTEALAAYGLTPEELPRDAAGLRKLALEMDNPVFSRLIGAGGGLDLSAADETWDYETNEILLTEEDILRSYDDYPDYLDLVRREWAEREEDYRPVSIEDYLNNRDSVLFSSSPVEGGGMLFGAMDAIAVGKVKGRDIRVMPITSPNGTVSAEVAYWGAVNANTDKAELAYEFLRTFLTPEVQLQRGLEWEGYTYSTRLEISNAACPVRTDGYLQMRVDEALRQFGPQGNTECVEALKNTVFTREDAAILDTKIDRILFPTELDAGMRDFFQYYLQDPHAVTEEEIRQAAREYLQKIRVHLDES